MANKRICVVLVIDDLEYGGAQRQVVELANNMDAERFDVHVCTLSDYVPLGDQLRDSQRRLHTVIKKNKFDFTVVPRLAHLLKKLDADIVHSYLFGADIATRLAGRLARVGLVVGSERNANYDPKKRHVFAYKMTRSCVDLMIPNSNAGADFNRERFSQSAIDYRVVHNGVDTVRFTPCEKAAKKKELGLDETKGVIGVFASFKPQKNHSMLLKAFKKVLESLPDTQLLLVGGQLHGNMHGTDEYNWQLEELIEKLNIKHRCVFLGNRDDVEKIYPACDLTVLSSLFEGTPNALLESMASGVTVVATNVSDNSYVVKDGQTGYIVELDDIDGMAERITGLLSDKSLCQQMGQASRNWMEQEFSLTQLAKKTEAVYLEALRSKRKKKTRVAK